MASGSQGEESITNPAGGTAMGCAGGRSAGRAEGAQMPGDARPPAGTVGCRVGRVVGVTVTARLPCSADQSQLPIRHVSGFPGRPTQDLAAMLCQRDHRTGNGLCPECGDRAPYAASLQCRVGHRGGLRGRAPYAASLQCRVGHRGGLRGRAPDDPAPRTLVRLHRGGTATGSCCQTTPAWSMAGQFYDGSATTAGYDSLARHHQAWAPLGRSNMPGCCVVASVPPWLRCNTPSRMRAIPAGLTFAAHRRDPNHLRTPSPTWAMRQPTKE
jgi:hypothetical protein